VRDGGIVTGLNWIRCMKPDEMLDAGPEVIGGNTATGSCGGNLSERLNRLQRSIGKSCMQLWMWRQSIEIKAPGITAFFKKHFKI